MDERLRVLQLNSTESVWAISIIPRVGVIDTQQVVEAKGRFWSQFLALGGGRKSKTVRKPHIKTNNTSSLNDYNNNLTTM